MDTQSDTKLIILTLLGIAIMCGLIELVYQTL
jgi:hypothetical protein